MILRHLLCHTKCTKKIKMPEIFDFIFLQIMSSKYKNGNHGGLKLRVTDGTITEPMVINIQFCSIDFIFSWTL